MLLERDDKNGMMMKKRSIQNWHMCICRVCYVYVINISLYVYMYVYVCMYVYFYVCVCMYGAGIGPMYAIPKALEKV